MDANFLMLCNFDNDLCQEEEDLIAAHRVEVEETMELVREVLSSLYPWRTAYFCI